jgi:hypothetical protein
MKLKKMLLAALVLTFGLSLASAQVKIAEIAGAPGQFDYSTSVAFHTATNTGFVSNPGSGLVQRFRPATGEVLSSVQLPPGAGSLAVASDGLNLVVANPANQKIYIIDPATMKVRVETSYPNSSFTGRCNIIIGKDNVNFFIADPARDGVASFFMWNGALDHVISVGINPTLMINHPNPNSYLVAVLCSGRKVDDTESIYILDTFKSAVADFANLPNFNAESFNGVAFDSTGQWVYAAAYNSSRIAIYNLKSYSLSYIESKGANATGSKASGPTKLVTSPNGTFMAVIHAGSKSISILRLPELLLFNEIAVPGLEFSTDSNVVFSADSHSLFVPSLTNSEILMFNVEAKTLTSRIAVARQPLHLYLNPNGQSLASVDVGSNLISLLALNPTTLYIPDLSQNAKDYSGVALANFGVASTSVSLTARDDTGAIIPGTTNPRLITLTPNQQVPAIADQIFGFNPNLTLSGYIEVNTLGSNVTILYLSGDIVQTQLDGFIADSKTSKFLGFERITEDMNKYGKTTSTEIVLLNPTENVAHMNVRMFYKTLSGPGQLIANFDKTLAPHSRIRQRVKDYVPTAYYPLDKGYLEINSDQPLKGMVWVRIGDSLAAIPAFDRTSLSTIFTAAQFASGGAGVLDTPIFSNLAMANSTTSPITVTAQVTDINGKLVPPGAKPTQIVVLPDDVVEGGANELLNFPDPLVDPTLYLGTLQIVADKPGLALDLLYGDARNGRYLTTAALEVPTGTKFAIGHIAEGLFGNPAKGLYTGLAIFNPNRGMTNLQIEVYSPDGQLIRHTNVPLESLSRVSKTIGQFFDVQNMQQNGGTIKVTSDLPVVMFSVFGSTTSEFLVAVPPLVLAP